MEIASKNYSKYRIVLLISKSVKLSISIDRRFILNFVQPCNIRHTFLDLSILLSQSLCDFFALSDIFSASCIYSSSFIFGHFNCNFVICISVSAKRCLHVLVTCMLTCIGMFACFVQSTKNKVYTKDTKNNIYPLTDARFAIRTGQNKNGKRKGETQYWQQKLQRDQKCNTHINEWSEWENNKTMTNKSWNSNLCITYMMILNGKRNACCAISH